MVVDKVINNNIVSAFDETGQEVVVMGRGIGFKSGKGAPVSDDKIEKIFRMQSKTLAEQFKELLVHMPIEHVRISNAIIAHAKKELGMTLNQTIYVTLTDHINFALERTRQNIQLKNALLWEIKHLYQQESLLGQYAVELIKKELQVDLGEDEAGFIALHFVNAQYDVELKDTLNITKLIHGGLSIVKEELGAAPNEDTLHYERFLTHMKFLAQRIYKGQLLQKSGSEDELSLMMQRKCPKEYRCSQKIAKFIEKEFHTVLPEEEVTYLTIHIRRIFM